MNLPTDLLRAFVTVAQEGSVTAAGEILGRSQPAISLQIKRLEDLLELSLFQRGNRRLTLTEKGKTLYEYADHMLSINDEALNRLTRPSLDGNVHLGLPNEFAVSFLPVILRRYALTHPEVTVQVSCDLSVNLQSRLAEGEFDMVLALEGDRPLSSSVCSWREEVVWAGVAGSQAHRTHPLPLIVAPEGCVYRQRMLQTLDSQDREWRIAYSSPNFSGIKAGVVAGLGITAIARSTLADGFKILGAKEHLPALPNVRMCLLQADDALSPAAQRLVEHISTHVKPATQVTAAAAHS